MSASGKRNDVKEGDVYLDDDGLMCLFFKNSNAVWYCVYLKDSLMWVSDATRSPYVQPSYKYVMSVKELLVSVRKELQSEPSN
jgi:hypothetical protein